MLRQLAHLAKVSSSKSVILVVGVVLSSFPSGAEDGGGSAISGTGKYLVSENTRIVKLEKKEWSHQRETKQMSGPYSYRTVAVGLLLLFLDFHVIYCGR